ncbi:MAG: glycosyltransferase family 39 protein [Gammaproteobacteria bacterium]|nr:glycosyltransferase family 39 protein [Gammaproteobacteria bacterium]
MRDQAERTEATEFLSDARLLAAACGLLLIVKVWLASRLDLYSDEIFYWLASTMPAPAYSDLPFVTALLAGLGSALDPGNPLATRALFLAGGSCLPAVVYWVSLPFAGRRDALQAALLSICIPLGGFLGLLAVPDVPMLLCGLIGLGFLDRALRTDGIGHWLAAGAFMALGLCTHYRFVLFPAAAMLYLLLHRRDVWRNGGFLLAAGIAAIGLFPILWANLPGNMGSASFYFVERHPWQFNAEGLLQVPMQILIVTPPLYALLLYSAWLMFKRRDTHVNLLLWVAVPHLLVYALFAPWSDANSTTEHWPLPGYFPLLVFAPEALRRTQAWLARRLTGAALAAGAIPAIGFAGALIALAGIGSQSWQTQLQPFVGAGVLSEKMAGWEEFAEHTGQLLREDFDGQPVTVTDNYYTAAQLQFAEVAAGAYTLDMDKAVRDGRFRQFELWGRTGEFVRLRPGEPMLFITEDSALDVEQKHELMSRACGLADSLEQIDQLSLFEGDKRFGFYRGRVSAEINAPAASPCPYPPRAWIDQPAQGAILSGTIAVGGWAYNEDLGVERVLLLLDGDVIAEFEYGLPRPDVVEARDFRTDPNQPNLGFRGEFDTAAFASGRRELSIRIIDSRGFATDYGRREVVLENP